MAPCQSVSVASTTLPGHLPPLCYVDSLLLTSLTALPMIHSLLLQGEMYYNKRKNFVFLGKKSFCCSHSPTRSEYGAGRV